MDSSPLSPSIATVINQSRSKPQGMVDGGRKGILGNPFDMKGNETLRFPVCDAHNEYFERVMFDGEEPVVVAQAIAKERRLTLARAWKRPTRKAYVAEINRIDGVVANGKPVQIGCYCAPAACHCDRLAAHFNRDRTLENVAQPVAPKAGEELRGWVIEHGIKRLNCAGNQESKAPGLEAKVATVIEAAFTERLPELEQQSQKAQTQQPKNQTTSALTRSVGAKSAIRVGDRSNRQTIRYVYLIEEGMELNEHQQSSAKERVKEVVRRQIEGAAAIYAVPEFYANSAVGKEWIETALNQLPQHRGKAVVLDNQSIEEHGNADHYQIVGISIGKDPQIKNQLILANHLGTPAIAYNPATNKLVNLQPQPTAVKEGVSR